MGAHPPSAHIPAPAPDQAVLSLAAPDLVRPAPRPLAEAPRATEPSLADLYAQWFCAILADTPELRREAFRLRYQVYCVENPFEDPADNPHEEESDAFDAHSVHSLLIHRPTGMVAGTVRLVLPLPDALDRSFAFQRVCHEPIVRDPKAFPILRMAEVSRFSISKAFRKRCTDGRYPDEHAGAPRTDGTERRILPHMTLGLIESLVRMSVQHHVSYWCAVMEPTLLRLLSRLGIYFDPIGPLVDYHGRRQPCYIKLTTLLARVARERPDVWEVLTDRGRHWQALLEQESSHQRSR